MLRAIHFSSLLSLTHSFFVRWKYLAISNLVLEYNTVSDRNISLLHFSLCCIDSNDYSLSLSLSVSFSLFYNSVQFNATRTDPLLFFPHSLLSSLSLSFSSSYYSLFRLNTKSDSPSLSLSFSLPIHLKRIMNLDWSVSVHSPKEKDADGERSILVTCFRIRYGKW